jgi:hypothetical protein
MLQRCCPDFKCIKGRLTLQFIGKSSMQATLGRIFAKCATVLDYFELVSAKLVLIGLAGSINSFLD